jgi:uncharacterized protein YkwD
VKSFCLRAVLTVLLGFTGVAVVATPSAASVEAIAVAPSFDQRILYWTNTARLNHGLPPLRLGSCLDGYAERWTRHMAAQDDYRHQELRPMLIDCHKRTVGENIAWSRNMTARQVVRMWMNSPGHRTHILSRSFRTIGIAAWKSSDSGIVYVTQDFGG